MIDFCLRRIRSIRLNGDIHGSISWLLFAVAIVLEWVSRALRRIRAWSVPFVLFLMYVVYKHKMVMVIMHDVILD